MSGSIKASLHIEYRKSIWRLSLRRPSMPTLALRQKTKTRLCILMPWSPPESTACLSRSCVARLAASRIHVNLGNSGSPGLCVVLSPLWGALHYFPLPLQNIHTFLSHSSQASHVQKHFITAHLLLLTCFLVPICLNGSITLILKVQSICLQMQDAMLSWFYIQYRHILEITAFSHPLIAEKTPLDSFCLLAPQTKPKNLW